MFFALKSTDALDPNRRHERKAISFAPMWLAELRSLAGHLPKRDNKWDMYYNPRFLGPVAAGLLGQDYKACIPAHENGLPPLS